MPVFLVLLTMAFYTIYADPSQNLQMLLDFSMKILQEAAMFDHNYPT
jgi:hypothetical protein